MDRSALVVVSGEAESVVSPTRHQYDPSAAHGMPAHITLLYPFVPPRMLDHSTQLSVAAVARSHSSFSYSLHEMKQFPGALYLAPSPSQPFRALASDLAMAFPDYPPYEGQFAEIVPHLTVASSPHERAFPRIEREFAKAQAGGLRVQCHASEVSLFVFQDRAWRPAWSVPLGAPAV